MLREMKDSGIEWISDIPVHWRTEKLSRITNSYSGGTPSRNNEKYWIGGEIPWASSGEVNKEFIYETNEKITESGLNNSSAKLFPISTVIVALNGQGKTKGMSAILMIEASSNQSLVGFICNKEFLHYKFLYYCFKASYRFNRSYYAGGNNREGIAAGDLRKSKIPLAPVHEQQKIISFLDEKTYQIDSIIEKTKQSIEELKKYKQSLITETVTKGLYPGIEMKESGVKWIESIPKHWDLSYFKYEIYIRARLGWKGLKASEYVDKGIAFLSTPNIKGEYIDFNNVNYITRERYDESPEIKLSKNDVLLTKDGSTLGTVNIVRSLCEDATVNSSIAVLTPAVSLDAIYLYYLIMSDYIQNEIRVKKDGMGVPHLFQKDIKEFRLILPPLDEQIQISTYLDGKVQSINQIISNKDKLIFELENYKKSLIYEYVTGKKEVM